MMTVRQIERLWVAKSYAKLLDDLLVSRTESIFRLRIADTPAAAAAMGMIRLDELNQSHAPLFAALLRAVLAAQEADGGWGEPMATALCVRALSVCHGGGLAVDRGMDYLAALQQPQGTWPNVPIRRMPADAYVSAFILFQLGGNPLFRGRVRLADAIAWFKGHSSALEGECRTAWDRACLRCGRTGKAYDRAQNEPALELSWS